MSRRATLVLILLMVPLAAGGQPFPSKPVRIVDSFAAGGATDIVVRHDAIGMRRALQQADTTEKFVAIGVDIRGVDIRGSTPEELHAFGTSERAKWGKIVRDSGAKLD